MTILAFPKPNPFKRFLSLESVAPFYPFPIFGDDLDEPFGFIPDAPGVIALGSSNGEATVIEACRSMRERVESHWKGFEGGATVSATFLAFEATANPMRREEELLREHRQRFGVLPVLNRA